MCFYYQSFILHRKHSWRAIMTCHFYQQCLLSTIPTCQAFYSWPGLKMECFPKIFEDKSKNPCPIWIRLWSYSQTVDNNDITCTVSQNYNPMVTCWGKQGFLRSYVVDLVFCCVDKPSKIFFHPFNADFSIMLNKVIFLHRTLVDLFPNKNWS